MTGNPHRYHCTLAWTGNRGTGTSGYRDYDRSFDLGAEGKPTVHGSADPTFRGDRMRWNPEEQLLGALSSCHMLSYLHVCADAGIVVLRYSDAAVGTMDLDPTGSGRFTAVILRPHVTITPENDAETARILHGLAHEKCFIANSVSFPVRCEAVVVLAAPAATSLSSSQTVA